MINFLLLRLKLAFFDSHPKVMKLSLCSIFMLGKTFNPFHSEQPKLYGLLAVLSAIGLNSHQTKPLHVAQIFMVSIICLSHNFYYFNSKQGNEFITLDPVVITVHC